MYAPQNLLTQWSRLVMGALAAAGIEHVVISPGSRNGPLTIAALAHAGLSKFSVIDERSAGFFALGLTRVTGKPVALLCTSGSALAHYLPALIEAHHAELPLVVLSADRPQELEHTSAPQTIHQANLYGRYAKLFIDLGDARADDDNLHALARKITQAVHVARSSAPGPVHINVPMRKPLEPEDALTPEQRALVTRVDGVLGRGLRLPESKLALTEEIHAELRSKICDEPALLLSAGPLPTESLRLLARVAERAGAYLLSEMPGNAAPVEGLARLLGKGSQLPEPRVIIHFGPPPLSASWQARLKDGVAELIVVGAGEHPDAGGRANAVLKCDVHLLLARLADELQASEPPPARAAFTAEFERTARGVVERIVRETTLAGYKPPASTPSGVPLLAEPAAVAHVLAALPAGAELCLGNSLPVRLASWVAPTCQLEDVRVHTQRGAAGIDGLIAGAAGVCTAAGRPTLLLVGDVSAAHDLSSLTLARQVQHPLCICVLDNDGGRIFDHLPLASGLGNHPDFRFWLTPPGIDWQAAAQAYGVAFRSASHLDGVEREVRSALSTPGPTLLLLRTDSESSKALLRAFGPAVRQGGGLN